MPNSLSPFEEYSLNTYLLTPILGEINGRSMWVGQRYVSRGRSKFII